MGKMITITIIIILLDLLFLIAGYNTLTGSTLEKIGLVKGADNNYAPGDFKSTVFGELLGKIAALSAAAVAIGIIIFSKHMDSILLTQVLFMAAFFSWLIGDLVSISGIIGSEFGAVGWFISIIVFGPLLAAFVISAVEWIRGTST